MPSAAALDAARRSSEADQSHGHGPTTTASPPPKRRLACVVTRRAVVPPGLGSLAPLARCRLAPLAGGQARKRGAKGITRVHGAARLRRALRAASCPVGFGGRAAPPRCIARARRALRAPIVVLAAGPPSALQPATGPFRPPGDQRRRAAPSGLPAFGGNFRLSAAAVAGSDLPGSAEENGALPKRSGGQREASTCDVWSLEMGCGKAAAVDCGTALA